ncbi:MAG: hypothetical protein IKR04_07105, partial [Clostridia bacterium]|nr:hypothetical protein [Clostridia bacterium]
MNKKAIFLRILVLALLTITIFSIKDKFVVYGSGHEHTYTAWHKTADATCTEAEKGYYYCTGHNGSTAYHGNATTTGDPLGHDWQGDGHTQTCSRCGETQVNSGHGVSTSIGHNETNHWNKCTASGCDYKYNSTGHTYYPYENTGDGTHSQECRVCSYVKEGKCNKSGAVHAAFDEAGYHYKECTDCKRFRGDFYKVDCIIGTYEIIEGNENNHWINCTDCLKHIKLEVHKYSEAGGEQHICDKCGFVSEEYPHHWYSAINYGSNKCAHPLCSVTCDISVDGGDWIGSLGTPSTYCVADSGIKWTNSNKGGTITVNASHIPYLSSTGSDTHQCALIYGTYPHKSHTAHANPEAYDSDAYGTHVTNNTAGNYVAQVVTNMSKAGAPYYAQDSAAKSYSDYIEQHKTETPDNVQHDQDWHVNASQMKYYKVPDFSASAQGYHDFAGTSCTIPIPGDSHAVFGGLQFTSGSYNPWGQKRLTCGGHGGPSKQDPIPGYLTLGYRDTNGHCIKGAPQDCVYIYPDVYYGVEAKYQADHDMLNGLGWRYVGYILYNEATINNLYLTNYMPGEDDVDPTTGYTNKFGTNHTATNIQNYIPEDVDSTGKLMMGRTNLFNNPGYHSKTESSGSVTLKYGDRAYYVVFIYEPVKVTVNHFDVEGTSKSLINTNMNSVYYLPFRENATARNYKDETGTHNSSNHKDDTGSEGETIKHYNKSFDKYIYPVYVLEKYVTKNANGETLAPYTSSNYVLRDLISEPVYDYNKHTTEIDGGLSQRQKGFYLPSDCQKAANGKIPDINIEFIYSTLKLQIRNYLVTNNGNTKTLITPPGAILLNRTASNFTVNSLVTLLGDYTYYKNIPYSYGSSYMPLGTTFYTYGVEAYNNDTGNFDEIRKPGPYGVVEDKLKSLQYFMFSSATHLDESQRQRTLRTRQVNVDFYYFLDNVLFVDYLKEGTRSKLIGTRGPKAFGLHDITEEILQLRNYGVKFTRYELFDTIDGVDTNKIEKKSPEVNEGDKVTVQYNEKNRHLIQWFDDSGLDIIAEFHDVTGGMDVKIESVATDQYQQKLLPVDVAYKSLEYLGYKYVGYTLYDGNTQATPVTETGDNAKQSVRVYNNKNDRLVVFNYILEKTGNRNIVIKYVDKDTNEELSPKTGFVIDKQITHIERKSITGYDYVDYKLYNNQNEVDSDLTSSSSAQYVDVVDNENNRLVIFYYRKTSTPNIVIKYLDEDTNLELASQDNGQFTTNTLHYNNKDIKQYTYTGYVLYNHLNASLDDITSKGTAPGLDVTNNGNDRLLVFLYRKIERPSIIIQYLDEDTKQPVKLEELKKMDLDTYTFTGPDIYGYNYVRYVLYNNMTEDAGNITKQATGEKSVVVNNNNNNRLLIFYYKCVVHPNIIIRHVSGVTGNDLLEPQLVVIDHSPLTFNKATNIPGFDIYTGYTLYNHQQVNSADVTSKGDGAIGTVNVIDNTFDRLLIFEYLPYELKIIEPETNVDLHDVIIAGEFETNVELKSNGVNIDDDPRSDAVQEYDVEREAIPTSEDMYANVTTASYTLEDYASGEEMTKKLDITLVLQYRDNANEGKSGKTTSESAETGTYRIKAITLNDVDLKYFYLSGRNTILKPLHHAEVKNEAIESWSKNNAGEIVHRDDEVWLYPAWDINQFNMYFKAGGDLILSDKIRTISESEIADGKERDASNLIPMGMYNFKKVSDNKYSFAWVVEEREVFAVTGGSVSGHREQAEKQAYNFLVNYFNNNIAMHFKEWLKSQGVKIQTDTLIIYSPDNPTTGDTIYNGKPIDFSDDNTDYPELEYRDKGFFQYKPTPTNPNRLFLKGTDKEAIYTSKNTANSLNDSPYKTTADIYFATYKKVNKNVAGDTGNIMNVEQKIDDPIQPGFKDVAGNNVGVQTPVVDDSHVIRDAIVNQKAVKRTEDDMFTYLQLDGTFSVDIPWTTTKDTINYKGYGKRNNSAYGTYVDAIGSYNAFGGGNQLAFNYMKNTPLNAPPTSSSDEIAHYQHFGNTYTSWGAVKDVKIPFDTYVDFSGITGFNKGTKLFIPGGVWLSDALLNYTNSKIYKNGTDYYNGTYDATIVAKLKTIRERTGDTQVRLTLDQIREFYRESEVTAKKKTSFKYTVPVWVDEIVYKIETRVISENALDLTNFKEVNGRLNATGEYYNGSRDQYVAYKEHYAQVIGVIYDLKIESSEDPDWASLDNPDKTAGATGGKIDSKFFPFGGTNKSTLLDGLTVNGTAANQQNKNKSYPYAPKLGYSFAFSFKVKGRKSNVINIGIANQKFYIAYKDSGTTEEVDLWFKKSSSSEYVKIGDLENANSELLIAPSDSFLKIPSASIALSNQIYPAKELI